MLQPLQLVSKLPCFIIVLLWCISCNSEEGLTGRVFIGPNGLSELDFINDSLLVISAIEKEPDTTIWFQSESEVYLPRDTLTISNGSLIRNGHLFQAQSVGPSASIAFSDFINQKFKCRGPGTHQDYFLFMDDGLISYGQSLAHANLKWKLLEFKGRQYLKLPLPAQGHEYLFPLAADSSSLSFSLYNTQSLTYQKVSMVQEP